MSISIPVLRLWMGIASNISLVPDGVPLFTTL